VKKPVSVSAPASRFGLPDSRTKLIDRVKETALSIKNRHCCQSGAIFVIDGGLIAQ
jgi:hypothetical protein